MWGGAFTTSLYVLAVWGPLVQYEVAQDPEYFDPHRPAVLMPAIDGGAGGDAGGDAAGERLCSLAYL